MIPFIQQYPWLLDILDEDQANQVKRSLKKPYSDIGEIKDEFWDEFHYSSIGTGAFRECYNTNIGWIIKFPFGDDGIECNLIEANIYKVFSHTGRYAKCYIKMYHEVPLLVMETVTNYFSIKDAPPMGLLPHWIHHEDGPQIGYNKNGKLRIYDYAACFQTLLYWRQNSIKKSLTKVSK